MPFDPDEQARDQELELQWEFGPGEDRDPSRRTFDPSYMTGELRAHLREAAAFRGGHITSSDVEDTEAIFDLDVTDIIAEAKALGIPLK